MTDDSAGRDDPGAERPDDDRQRRRGLLPGGSWVRDQRERASGAGAGLQFGLTICIFALLGLWLDGRFGTSPWLLLAGVVLAFVGGTISLLKKFG